MTKTELEKNLSDFDLKIRTSALRELLFLTKEQPRSTDMINLHFHTFYSYNSESWSPSRIAWESWKNGLFASGIVDFDVIDGMEEFLEASKLLGIRACAGVETRTFFAKFANAEMDSPGEPGVNYVMGVGFTKNFPKDSFQSLKLAGYRENARRRNLALIERINSVLNETAVDYDKDVLPLTPSGNATERHIISAYVQKSFDVFKTERETFEHMSKIFGKTTDELAGIFKTSRPAYDELARAKFAKKGGIGYTQPSQETFPPMKDFLSWVKSCGAIPTEAWLDGTTKGESLGIKYMEASREEGAEALNIIPDRNWNIKDTEIRKIKIAKLAEAVAAAEKLEMPVFIGTEMNKAGQPFADDIDCGALAPHKQIFLKGAAIAAGHSILAKFADTPYSGEKASAEFKTTADKNTFFENVGRLPPLTKHIAGKLEKNSIEISFAKIADSAKFGKWKI
jgi:hypothetical protein